MKGGGGRGVGGVVGGGGGGGQVAGQTKNHKRSHIRNFSQVIFKSGKDIYCPKISDEFDFRGSASLLEIYK